MRLFVRSATARSMPLPTPLAAEVGERRREWVEALFAEHLPREPHGRAEAIAALAGDAEVWRLLHQARHSVAETTAVIEQLAALAASQRSPLRAA